MNENENKNRNKRLFKHDFNNLITIILTINYVSWGFGVLGFWALGVNN